MELICVLIVWLDILIKLLMFMIMFCLYSPQSMRMIFQIRDIGIYGIYIQGAWRSLNN